MLLSLDGWEYTPHAKYDIIRSCYFIAKSINQEPDRHKKAKEGYRWSKKGKIEELITLNPL